MTQALRERTFGLLAELCGDLPTDTLRVASHALLGLATDADTDALLQLRDAMPWLAAFLELEDEGSPEDVARRLHARGALRSLAPRYIAQRLCNDAYGSARGAAIKDLAQLDRRLFSLSRASALEIRDAVLDDIQLMVAALEVMDDAPECLPEIRTALGVCEQNVGPLHVLATLETSWNGLKSSVLSDRSGRFELSAVDHLRQNGFLVAVRAALGLTCDGETLRGYSVFREDPSLEQLTRALMKVRGLAMEHLRGMVPLRALRGWVEYLRGACSDIAESRGITLREATSFAHFCWHVMNFCDLYDACGAAAHDALRRSLMDIEDEVKEFALMGMTAGVSDQNANLGAFDAARWRRHGTAAFAADRVARLAGAWRLGTAPAPMGAPSRVGGEVADEARRAVMDADSRFPGAAHLVGATMAHAQIVGAQWCERIAPGAVFAMLALCFARARDAGVDLGRPLRVDVTRLGEWTKTPLRSLVFEKWLTHAALHQAMVGIEEQTTVEVTVVGQDIQIGFAPSPALEAALTLMVSGVGPAHQGYLASLVNDLLGIHDFEERHVMLM